MQIHPALLEAFISSREREARERALRAANRRAWRSLNGAEPRDRPEDAISIRPARPEDAKALFRLAQLDGQSRLGDRLAKAAVDAGAQRLLVAEANGSLVASLDTSTRRVVADPFRRSAAARELLELRAQQLGAGERRPAGRSRLLRLSLRPRTG